MPPYIPGMGIAIGLFATALVQSGTLGAYVGLALFVFVGGLSVYYIVTHWRRHG